MAPWGAPGAPGRFQVLLNGKPVGETFGTKNADWHWHDGGTVEVGAETTIALHAVAQAQKAGGVAAFIDAEHALDPSWAKRIGVDLEVGTRGFFSQIPFEVVVSSCGAGRTAGHRRDSAGGDFALGL